MPIYDNDGTTNYQIGKLYDNDGSTNYQIGKVYDNDGTTGYLIYTGEAILFPGTSDYSGGWSTAGVTSSNADVSDTHLGANASYNATNGKVYSTQKISMDGFSKITFNVPYGNFAGQVIVGIASTTGVYTTGSAWTKYVQVTATGDWSIDVSSVTGSYYVIVSVWTNEYVNPWINVYKIVAE